LPHVAERTGSTSALLVFVLLLPLLLTAVLGER